VPLNHMLKKYYTQSEEQDDLISIGTIGLIKGISTFKPEKGARLATYAARCVENAILTQRNKRRLRWRNKLLLMQNGVC
jgi:RNA polymerase sporulation-specific sigma factor